MEYTCYKKINGPVDDPWLNFLLWVPFKKRHLHISYNPQQKRFAENLDLAFLKALDCAEDIMAYLVGASSSPE